MLKMGTGSIFRTGECSRESLQGSILRLGSWFIDALRNSWFVTQYFKQNMLRIMVMPWMGLLTAEDTKISSTQRIKTVTDSDFHMEEVPARPASLYGSFCCHAH